MFIKTPDFWYNSTRPSFVANLMRPFACAYHAISTLNYRLKKTKSVTPFVICIGNVTAGGSGKTPSAIALSELITENSLFKNQAFLSRGYGSSDNSTRCITGHEPFQDVGDEPLLLSSIAQTIVSPDRIKGAELAQSMGADCIIMDDGFQNPKLKKDLSFLVIDGAKGFGNGLILPAGPLREKPDNAFQRADAVILIGQDKAGILAQIPKSVPVFTCNITPTRNSLDKNKPYYAFAGLAHPDKFQRTLEKSGFSLEGFKSFADHYPYEENDINALKKSAAINNAVLVTTEKDYVRIPKDMRDDIETLPIEMTWDRKDDLIEFLKTKVKVL